MFFTKRPNGEIQRKIVDRFPQNSQKHIHEGNIDSIEEFLKPILFVYKKSLKFFVNSHKDFVEIWV